MTTGLALPTAAAACVPPNPLPPPAPLSRPQGAAGVDAAWPGQPWLDAWCEAYRPHLAHAPARAAACALYRLATLQHVPPEDWEQQAAAHADAALDSWVCQLVALDPELHSWAVPEVGLEEEGGPQAPTPRASGRPTAGGDSSSSGSGGWLGALELAQLSWALGASAAACPVGLSRDPGRAQAQLALRATHRRACAAGLLAAASLAGAVQDVQQHAALDQPDAAGTMHARRGRALAAAAVAADVMWGMAAAGLPPPSNSSVLWRALAARLEDVLLPAGTVPAHGARQGQGAQAGGQPS